MDLSLGYLVLAAGKGTRMHTSVPKVMVRILGKPLLGYVYDLLSSVENSKIWTVVGHKSHTIIDEFGENKQFIIQENQLGTGHALMVAWDVIKDSQVKYVCVINGDTPYVPIDSINRIAVKCSISNSAMGVLTINLDNPFGYGRIIRSNSLEISCIVEEKDFDKSFYGEISEVNSGIYVFDVGKCGKLLSKMNQSNAQGEFYITQLLALSLEAGYSIVSENYEFPADLRGINSPGELVSREEEMRGKIVSDWIAAGVIIRNSAAVVIGPDVSLEPGVDLTGPCEIYGRTRIGRGTSVASHCWIRDSELRACQVKSFSHIEGSVIENGAVVGPFARLRPGSVAGANVRIGNFVEVKNSTLRDGAKAGHLAYLGDCEIGAGVNIGAGTITCNYDGHRKHRTEVRDRAFIGSNTSLVAPVVVGASAVVGAGSVVTKNVPDGELCIGRARQVNLPRKSRVVTFEDQD